MAELRRVPPTHPDALVVNLLIDAVLGNGGGRLNLVGDESGVKRRLDGGRTLSSGHYRGVFKSLNGNHLAALRSTSAATAAPSATTAVLRVTDAGLLLGNGAALGLSGPAGQQASLAVDASGNLNLSTGGTPRITIGATGGVGIGALPAAGYGLNVGGNIQALSGAAGTIEAIGLGRAAVETQIAVAAGPGQFITGTVAGDSVWNVAVPTARLFLGVGPTASVTAGQTAGAATLGFYGVTPVVRPLALTQTYATATRTHANLTAAAIAALAGTPQTGTADVGAISGQATINNNFATCVDQINKLRTDLTNLKQFVNAVVDDLQSLGLEQ